MSIRELLEVKPVINPSLLASDFANLESEIRRLERGGARILHLDIMDGHFVPNLSIGIPVVASIRRITKLPLDVHLMLDNPGDFLGPFRKAGADFLTVHIEVLPDPRPTFDAIRRLGAIPGIALNPPTAAEKVVPFLDDCELVLTMSVMPGFGGQSFDPIALDKIRRFNDIAGLDKLYSIDGGINEETIGLAAAAGANLLVAGTAVFQGRYHDYGEQMDYLLERERSTG